jgi:CRP/FNR family transcriptional regulator
VRDQFLFCNLQVSALKDLERVRSVASYPKGAILFLEGQPARGVFILCSGRAKLSMSSSDGKTIILRIAEPGEVLGLSAAISGKAYEVTVETLEPCQGNFIAREDLLRFVRTHGDASIHMAQELSNNYHCAYCDIRALGLGHSATERLAQLLLDWSKKSEGVRGDVRITVALTHEEIAQLIGSSRETVTRCFAELKRLNLIAVKGASVVIRDRNKLKETAKA